VRAGVFGATGYTGRELVRLLAAHPEVRLAFRTGSADGHLKHELGLEQDADAYFLALPHGISAEYAARLRRERPGAVVVDLSGDLRLSTADDYRTWYGHDHKAPELLGTAPYGLTEIYRDRVRGARLVSNPGCYATASTLGALALLKGGVVEPSGLVVDAASGTTGAGKKATEDFSFSEVDGDFRAYRVLRHQHTPEIERALALGGHDAGRVTFTPHLLPTRRGILATIYGRLRPGKTAADATAAVAAFVADKSFLRAAKPDAVRLHPVIGTNRVLLGADADPERGVAVAFAAIDNLVKGATGQAVQNANLMFGLEETTGLVRLPESAP